MSLLPYLLERRRAFELGYDEDLLNAVTSSLMGGDTPWRTISQGFYMYIIGTSKYAVSSLMWDAVVSACHDGKRALNVSL